MFTIINIEVFFAHTLYHSEKEAQDFCYTVKYFSFRYPQ